MWLCLFSQPDKVAKVQHMQIPWCALQVAIDAAAQAQAVTEAPE